MSYDMLILIIPWSCVFGYMTWDIFFNNDF